MEHLSGDNLSIIVLASVSVLDLMRRAAAWLLGRDAKLEETSTMLSQKIGRR